LTCTVTRGNFQIVAGRDSGASPPPLGPGISTGANTVSQPSEGTMTASRRTPARFIVDKVSPSYWKVTFENGLVNLIDGGSGREWRQ